jgi:ATP-dependent DNA helicase DinG
LTDFISEIEKIFSKKGILSMLPGYEFRKQQQLMAMKIAEGLENSEHQIIEAPTGIGKSYAYLIPSILFAVKNNKKAIISTCTINLQEQLISKDLPAIAELLDIHFSYEILKGRINYICLKRLNKALLERNTLFETEEQKILQKIYDFVIKENKGTKQDIPFRVSDNIWAEIFAEIGICTSKSCGSSDSNCFYQQAKQKIKDADLLVLNHYLFFTLFGFYERETQGYLYNNDFVIFDESHTIEQIASENISPTVSKEQIRFWLNKIYNPKNKKGFFANKNIERIKQIIEITIKDNDEFFKRLHHYITDKYQNIAYKTAIRIFEEISLGKELKESLTELTDELKRSLPTAKNDLEEAEIKNYITKIYDIKNKLDFFLRNDDNRFVYWAEYSGKSRSNIKLCISPINMAEYFRQNIFTENRVCAMTSATLSTNNNLDFFKKSIGAENIKGLILDSTFDYEKQMKIYLYKNIPEPKKRELQEVRDILIDGEFEIKLNEKIKECISKTKGGALVLFTNNRLLKSAFDNLLEDLLEMNINLYAQHNGMPNNKILQEFRKDENSVLFGVDSFWMGVDIPGSSLRNVIITKLPFDVPDHPVIEAKFELIRSKGRNPFMDYSLPMAILKFKQGAGRLIRTKNDEGIICILDSRILNKFYGKYFINSLPKCEIFIED